MGQERMAERAVEQHRLMQRLQQEQLEQLAQQSGSLPSGAAGDGIGAAALVEDAGEQHLRRREQQQRLQQQHYSQRGQDQEAAAEAAALGCIAPPEGAVREVRTGPRPPPK